MMPMEMEIIGVVIIIGFIIMALLTVYAIGLFLAEVTAKAIKARDQHRRRAP